MEYSWYAFIVDCLQKGILKKGVHLKLNYECIYNVQEGYVIILDSRPCTTGKSFTPASYHIAENFRGRKLSWISRFYSHPRKFSPQILGMPYPPMIGFSIPWKFSPRNGPSYWSAKVFSLESFPLYAMVWHPFPRCLYSNVYIRSFQP